MKKIYLSVLSTIFYLIATAASGPCQDLFFSEYIEGSSSNKALEIYNPTSGAVDLSNYSILRFSNGGTTASTFNLVGSLAPQDVFVIRNSSASIAEIIAEADTSGNATWYNGDDAVVLMHGTDTLDIIGVVGTDPGSSWSVGSGSTKDYTLVRKVSVNQGTTNWALSSTQWDVYPKDSATFIGSHTMTPCAPITNPSVRFSPTAASVSEGAGSVTITIENMDSLATASHTVDVQLITGDATDIGNYTTQTVTFAGTASQSITVNITDDSNIEGDEVLTFALVNATGGLTITTDSIFTLTIQDNEFHYYPIDLLRGNDTNAVADSIGVKCWTSGYVIGGNLRPAGLEFTIHNGTKGIGVFSPVPVSSYNVSEGDSIKILGKVVQYNKFSQIGFIDTIIVVGSATVQAPTVITDTLGEYTESELITIENATLKSGTWGDNKTVVIEANGKEYSVRLDGDAGGVGSMTAPTGKFHITGIGSQYNSSTSVLYKGYQLKPRKSADIELVQDTTTNPGGGNAIEDVNLAQLSIYPNPTSTTLNIALESNENQKATILIVDVLGKVVFNEVNTLNNGKNTLAIDVNHLAKGTYALTIATAKGTHTEQVIVK